MIYICNVCNKTIDSVEQKDEFIHARRGHWTHVNFFPCTDEHCLGLMEPTEIKILDK